MIDPRTYELAEGWLKGTLTDAEVREFLALMEMDGGLAEVVGEWLADGRFEGWAMMGRERLLFDRLMERARAEELERYEAGLRRARVRRMVRVGVGVAAAALVVVAGWWLSRPVVKAPAPAVAVVKPADLPPGGNKAVLTLNGGRQIVLDSAATGMLADQGGARVRKLASGRIDYMAREGGKEVVYNTLSTPRGGQYQLVLADGTKVWLNAASSITYPVAFWGERKVTITGEAYLEVARNPRQPFKVRVHTGAGEAEVTVLGTSFDVMAYGDEPETRVTLVEGSVRMMRGGLSRLLRPGEQVRLGNGDSLAARVVGGVDTEDAIAWTTGFFPFENLDMPAVLRQISRWYDVDVVDQSGGALRQRRFGGRISRMLPLSNALRLLESNKIHFRVENRKLMILP